MGTRDDKRCPRKLMTSVISNEPSKLQQEVKHRAGIARIPEQISPDDEGISSDDQESDDRIPPKEMPDKDKNYH